MSWKTNLQWETLYHTMFWTLDGIFRPVVRVNLLSVTTFFLILGWSLVTGSTIYIYFNTIKSLKSGYKGSDPELAGTIEQVAVAILFSIILYNTDTICGRGRGGHHLGFFPDFTLTGAWYRSRESWSPGRHQDGGGVFYYIFVHEYMLFIYLITILCHIRHN